MHHILLLRVLTMKVHEDHANIHRDASSLRTICTDLRVSLISIHYMPGQSHPNVPAVNNAYTSPSNVFFIVVLHGLLNQIDSCHRPTA